MVLGMISIILALNVELPVVLYQGMLEVDVDPLAERLVVIDRNTLERFVHASVSGGVYKYILPFVYTTSNDLMVLIFDDGGVYSAATVDGVQLQVIDGITTDIRT